jgi:hypothetical protein
VNTAIDPAAKAAPARRSAAPSSPAPAASRGGAVLALQARALAHESFLAAAIAVVND